MSKRHYLILFLLGVLIALAGGIWLRYPGYMDAEYYFVTGKLLSTGWGFQEPFVWNYLNSPERIPHASHGYWMPLTSIISAFAMVLAGTTFRAAQIPFILLTALLPILTTKCSLSIHQDRRAAFLAGLLSAVPGFFLPYFLTTDMFILYAWIGTIFFWSMHLAWRQKSRIMWLIVGLSIGLAHLSRADGLLFVIPLIYYLSIDRKRFLGRAGIVLVGYLLVMTPWFYRNWSVYGAVMPPGTQAALWLRSYEDLFRYPAVELNPGFLLQAGLKEIISTRLSALWTNVQRVIAENGLVFLLPVMLGGIVDRWKLRIVRAAVLYWATLLVMMSFVFPFAGAQGGMFHSSAALMPTLWILAPFGLRRIVAWVGVRRRWNISQATVNFGWIIVFLAAIFTLGVYAQRVYGVTESGRSWGSDFKIYENLGQRLTALRPEAEMVMVNNPPGFYGATGIKAIVVPSGGAESLKQALEDFNADYLVLDRNYPTGLGEIYARDQVPDWLVFRDKVNLGPAGPQLIFQAHLDSDG